MSNKNLSSKKVRFGRKMPVLLMMLVIFAISSTVFAFGGTEKEKTNTSRKSKRQNICSLMKHGTVAAGTLIGFGAGLPAGVGGAAIGGAVGTAVGGYLGDKVEGQCRNFMDQQEILKERKERKEKERKEKERKEKERKEKERKEREEKEKLEK